MGIGDYPWIPHVINESSMFSKIYDTLVVRSVNKAQTKCIFLHQPPPPFCPRGGGEGGGGGGVFLNSPPLSNFIGLYGHVKLFGVQGILGM